MRYTETFAPTLDIDRMKKFVADSTRSAPPPAGFDPMTASQAQLLALGFPSRPDAGLQPAEYAIWQDMFAAPLVFTDFAFDILLSFMVQSRGFSGQQTSGNWSGAYIMPRDGTVFRSIWGRWHVPAPVLPPGGVAADKYRSSTWIGFDGQRLYFRSTLPQIGTAQVIDEATGAPAYSAWWQWWVRDDVGQAVPITLTQLDIQPGNRIKCCMKVSKNRKKVFFLIKNAATGHLQHFVQHAPPVYGQHRFTVTGATAEWVMERPADAPNPTPLPLPDYGKVDFSHCGASAINRDTGAKVERSLSAARLIDMYIVKQNPERTVKISIAKPIDDTEFDTRFQQS